MFRFYTVESDYRISIIVEQIIPAEYPATKWVIVERDAISRHRKLSKALRIAKEIARTERREDDDGS